MVPSHSNSLFRAGRVLFSLLALTLATEASAQTTLTQSDRIMEIQLFHPGTLPGDFLGVRGTTLPEHGELTLGAYAIYQRNPLRPAFTPNTSRSTIVENQIAWEFAAAVSLWKRISVGVTLPFSIYSTCPSGDMTSGGCKDLRTTGFTSENFEGRGMGDVRLNLRGAILKPRGPFNVGLGGFASISFPTANATFMGEGNRQENGNSLSKSVFRPTGIIGLASDASLGKFRAGLNAGYLIRRDTSFLTLTIADQFLYGAAAAYRINRWVEGIAEFNGRLTLVKSAPKNNPHEAMLAARFGSGRFLLDTGIGVGVIGAYGAPLFRFFTGLTFTGGFGRTDTDGDGIMDRADKCPTEAEDKDGFEDNDGCPDLDNDMDGNPDPLDRCPMVAGVTADGCPLGDSDKDGVTDDRDQCLAVAEDKDGFEDNDGCPDTDNDRDGIADARDKCPGAPESYNGKDDDDGCPDQVAVAALPKAPSLERPVLEIGGEILFKTGQRELNAGNKKLLDKVSELLKANPVWGAIRVEAHTDNVGSPEVNYRLSEQRAQEVINYMVTKGVSSSRLQPGPYGSTRPISSNATEEGRAKNRRVQFVRIK